MLQLQKITKIFNKTDINEKTVLKDIRLHLAAGEFVTIIGSNGAGKSSLLNAIAGAWPLDEGKIIVAGKDITPLPAHRRAGLMGRVFQDPMVGTAPKMTIEENLCMAAGRGQRRGLARGIKGNLKMRMREELSRFDLDLENRLQAPVGLLSGGQRQALTLLMAIFRQPRLLLLDEHTAALDPKTGTKVLQLTRDMVDSLGLTTLMVTHNIADAINYGTRTIMMHEGEIIFDVKGYQREGLTPQDILRLFECQSAGAVSDRLFLAKSAI